MMKLLLWLSKKNALIKSHYLKHVLPCFQIWKRNVDSLVKSPSDGLQVTLTLAQK